MLAALVGVVLARGKLSEPGLWRAGGLLSVFLFLSYQLQTLGLAHTTPSRSAFITGLCVVFVPFVSRFVFKRPLPWLAPVGAAVAVCGLYFFSGGGGGFALGDLLTLGCAILYAVHIALVERYATRFSARGLVAAQLIFTAAACTVCVPFVNPRVEWSVSLAVTVIATGVFASALAFMVQTWGQARISAIKAAFIYALEPVFATAFSIAMGRERLTAGIALGGGLIIVGVWVGQLTFGAPGVLPQTEAP